MLGCQKPPPPAARATREWQLLASELPSALLSVSGRSATDIYAVGADKGRGPLVLHFDGKRWKELRTHWRAGDLWWVQALRTGPVLMAGAGATVLRFDGEHFERMQTPGLGRQTIYGVWGTDSENFYAVGSASGRDGFIWHYHGGAFEKETLPPDLPRSLRARAARIFQGLWAWRRSVGRGRGRDDPAPHGAVPFHGRADHHERHSLYRAWNRRSPPRRGRRRQRGASRGSTRNVQRRVTSRSQGSSRVSSRPTKATGPAGREASFTCATNRDPGPLQTSSITD